MERSARAARRAGSDSTPMPTSSASGCFVMRIEAGRRIGQLADPTSHDFARLVQEGERARLDVIDAEGVGYRQGEPEQIPGSMSSGRP